MAVPKFEITRDTSTVGFHTHVTIDLLKPLEDQLHRQKLYLRSGSEKGDPNTIKKIIENNSSLRLAFGWSFESERFLSDMMNECLYELCDSFNSSMPRIVSDMRGDWIGFMPYNSFEQYEIEQLSLYGMILFNNELINFQIDVAKFITQHRAYRQHAITRDRNYRFNLFKTIRKSPDDLDDAFQYFIAAIKETTGLPKVPRSYVEECVGTHYLHYPELFFELMEFYTLKGLIYE
jgi:hypothetical protein